jgi:cbb3-type cytochrome oxidase subunit 3
MDWSTFLTIISQLTISFVLCLIFAAVLAGIFRSGGTNNNDRKPE